MDLIFEFDEPELNSSLNNDSTQAPKDVQITGEAK